MSQAGHNIIDIPTRLEQPGRIFVFTYDEAALLFGPIIFGLVSKAAIIGIIVGFCLWRGWVLIKGEEGVYGLAGFFYWFVPNRLSGMNALPSSSVTYWAG